jgi:tetratricopeptide (TPR) repeat protein
MRTAAIIMWILPLRAGVALQEQTVDPEAPTTMLRLASVLLAQEKFDQAEQLMVRALNRMKQSPKSTPSAVAGALQGLAVIYWATERNREAEAIGQKALAVLTASGGSHNPEAAIILATLGQVRKALGKADLAAQCFERARAILEPLRSPELPNVLYLLGLLRYEQKKLGEAEQLYRQALEMKRGDDGEPALIANLMSALAIVRLKLGNRAEALNLSNQAVEIAGRAYAPGHRSTAAIFSNHAKVLRGFGRKHEAAAMETRAREIVRGARRGRTHQRVDVNALCR